MYNKHDDMLKGIGLLAVLVIVGIVALIAYLNRHQIQTEQLVQEQARIHHDDIPSETLLPERDAWGNQLRFVRDANPYAVTQAVTSAGKDGKFGTDDDITRIDRDVNKSRLVGKWVGGRAKEALKGVRDADSRFDQYDQPATKPAKKPLLERLFDRDQSK